jgi:hypothetical protein
MRQAASLSLGETCVGVMVAGSRWSVFSVAGSTIENAPKMLSDARTHRPGLSAGHESPLAARGGSVALAAAPSLSVGHGPPPAARGGGAAPGLSVGHGLCLLLAVAAPLLVCQPGTCLRLLLAVVGPLLPGCDGHGFFGSISSWSYRTLLFQSQLH